MRTPARHSGRVICQRCGKELDPTEARYAGWRDVYCRVCRWVRGK